MTNHFKYAVILIFFTACLVVGICLKDKMMELEARIIAGQKFIEMRYNMLSLEQQHFRAELANLKK